MLFNKKPDDDFDADFSARRSPSATHSPDAPGAVRKPRYVTDALRH